MKDDAPWYEAAQVVGVTNALNVVADALGASTPGLPALDPAAASPEARALFDDVRAFYRSADVPMPFRLMAHDPAYAVDVWQAVRPGDALRTTREIVEVRRSASRPDRGTIRTRVTVLNQRDEVVMTYYALGQVRARTTVSEAT